MCINALKNITLFLFKSYNRNCFIILQVHLGLFKGLVLHSEFNIVGLHVVHYPPCSSNRLEMLG